MSRALIAATMLLAGCSMGEEEPQAISGEVNSFTFVCPDGTAVQVSYPSPESAVVRVGDSEPFTLPRAMSGSGARYSDGTSEIWEAKGELRVTLADGTSYENCTGS